MKLDLKLYRGYANDNGLIVFGHLFKSWAPDKYSIQQSGIRHTSAILHKFRIEPLANQEIQLQFRDLKVSTKTMEDGYFRFNIPYQDKIESGWHDFEVTSQAENRDFHIIEKGELLKPFDSRYGIISDIDDTFLISHSDNPLKKLYVMLSKNLENRKVFDDVVPHYQMLSKAGQGDHAFNSFFYVSSSEWNLYDFIDEFAQLHELPKAVIKLKKIKTGLRDFVRSGRGSHDHKFVKIKDIITFYPDLKYVLLGDDSQHDPYIYENIIKTFPLNIKAVYIRQTSKKQKPEVLRVLQNMNSMKVETCYFHDSEKAIDHSRSVGLV